MTTTPQDRKTKARTKAEIEAENAELRARLSVVPNLADSDDTEPEDLDAVLDLDLSEGSDESLPLFRDPRTGTQIYMRALFAGDIPTLMKLQADLQASNSKLSASKGLNSLQAMADMTAQLEITGRFVLTEESFALAQRTSFVTFNTIVARALSRILSSLGK